MGKIYEALQHAQQASQGEPEIKVLDLFVEKPSALGKSLVVATNPDSVMAESFRFLRSKIIRPASGKPPRTILVTSALMGEGKTFVSSNLAVSISQGIEEFVLLVDADLRNSTIHEVFGLPFMKEGLSSYLAENVPLSALLLKTSINKLSILPSGSSSKTPAELLSSEKMKALIREVKDRYSDRFIVIDCPPVELVPETSVIANEVDGIILVVRYGQTPRQAVKSAMAKLQKEKILGVIFNGYNEPMKFYEQHGYKKYRHEKK